MGPNLSQLFGNGEKLYSFTLARHKIPQKQFHPHGSKAISLFSKDLYQQRGRAYPDARAPEKLLWWRLEKKQSLHPSRHFLFTGKLRICLHSCDILCLHKSSKYKSSEYPRLCLKLRRQQQINSSWSVFPPFRAIISTEDFLTKST